VEAEASYAALSEEAQELHATLALDTLALQRDLELPLPLPLDTRHRSRPPPRAPMDSDCDSDSESTLYSESDDERAH